MKYSMRPTGLCRLKLVPQIGIGLVWALGLQEIPPLEQAFLRETAQYSHILLGEHKAVSNRQILGEPLEKSEKKRNRIYSCLMIASQHKRLQAPIANRDCPHSHRFVRRLGNNAVAPLQAPPQKHGSWGLADPGGDRHDRRVLERVGPALVSHEGYRIRRA